MTDARTTELAEAVRARHVLVVGGGVAGLAAALECARIGLRVTLLEAADSLGGNVRSIELAGIRIDAAVEGYSARGGTVDALAADLGLSVVAAAPSHRWLAGEGLVRLPEESVLGIPQNPWDERVRRIIGWGGAWRAYLDRLRPPLTIGQQRSLGALVRTRMGERVLTGLVAPLSIGTFGIHPDDVDVEVAAPGLSSALTRTGSLGGAVAQLRGESDRTPALHALDGGMIRLVDAVRVRLGELGADIRTGARVAELVHRPDGRWLAADLPPADAVIVATTEIEARRLLAPHVPALDAEVRTPPETEVVTLAVRGDVRPELDAVFVVPGTHRTTGLVDSTARWPAQAVPRGIRVLRVTFGTLTEPPATASLDDPAARALAIAEAESMLGIPLEVGGFARSRLTPAPPVSALGHRDAAHATRSAVRAVRGLGVTGAWVSGSGLAQVIPDALAEAERVRRALLFPADAS